MQMIVIFAWTFQEDPSQTNTNIMLNFFAQYIFEKPQLGSSSRQDKVDNLRSASCISCTLGLVTGLMSNNPDI